jgi:hypothetical protein
MKNENYIDTNEKTSYGLSGFPERPEVVEDKIRNHPETDSYQVCQKVMDMKRFGEKKQESPIKKKATQASGDMVSEKPGSERPLFPVLPSPGIIQHEIGKDGKLNGNDAGNEIVETEDLCE